MLIFHNNLKIYGIIGNMNNFFDDINKNEILKYLNYVAGDIPKEIYSEIDECIEILKKNSKPRYFYEVYDIDSDEIKKLSVGEDIKELLRDSHSVILAAFTIGVEIEKITRRLTYSNLSKSVILDATASAGVEAGISKLNNYLSDEFFPEYLTDRFSPGYGDMPLDINNLFLKIINAEKRLGIKATQEGIMVPRKSVTCLIGISKFKQKHRHRGCENCKLFFECELRKRGENCGYE